MRFKKIVSMGEYAAWFFRQYSDLQQAQQNIYRIVDVKKSSHGQYKLIVQVIGKSVVVEFSPQEIVANDQMLEGFSKIDIRTITWLACRQINPPKYKIIMQEFCAVFNKILFKLKKNDSDEVILKTAGEITLDKNLVNNLSREDVRCVSYVAGYEQASVEKSTDLIE